MRISLSKTIILLFVNLVFSCNYYKNSGSQVVPQINSEDVTTLAIYNNYASINTFVLSNQCLSCHSEASGNKGGLNLETYIQIKSNLNQIMYRVLETKDMPPNPLPETQFNLLKYWLESGAPEHNTTNGPEASIQGPLNWFKIKNQILVKNCLECHQGEKAEANLDLSQLENFKNNADKIFNRVFIKQDMPPQIFATLSQNEKQAMMKWISQGFPQ